MADPRLDENVAGPDGFRVLRPERSLLSRCGRRVHQGGGDHQGETQTSRAHLRHGASVGGASRTSRSLSPGETSTSFRALTMTPSTWGTRSMSAIPAFGPRMTPPLARA